ncbi:primase-helicase family protein [Bacteroidota bacterium]
MTIHKYGNNFTRKIFTELGAAESEIQVYVKDINNKMIQMPIFSEDDSGNIHTLSYNLDRTLLPAGANTYPFFPPKLIEKYEQNIPIPTLVIVEGIFNAFKGAIQGMDIAGLRSISSYRDRKTNNLHSGILKIINSCQVENLIILFDSDCFYISEYALKYKEDLYKKPNRIFSSTRGIQELLKNSSINIYFSHIISDSHSSNPINLADLLIAFKDDEDTIINEISCFDKPGSFFFRMNITHSIQKLRRYLNLNSVDDFYSFHRDVIQDNEFLYNATHYIWDVSENVVKMMMPLAAKQYFRVGDSYYQYVKVPDKFHNIENKIERRLKGTIIDDHGKKFLDHIPKYLSFCNVPDHISYNKVIGNCYNIYSPFEHEAEEGDCSLIIHFLQHIFGEQLQLGLDYIQLLYQQPSQILPILCLVSKENQTGKTTFAKFLREIFTQNVTIVGNEELSASFNASYANKLIIICEETFLDKKQIIEKIKALSTADKILMNPKGKDHIEIAFFGKFILISNNEENFIYASKDDIRYWVRKINMPQEIIVNILDDMKKQIPHFLHFLNKRQLTTVQKSRMWFQPDLLKTHALMKIQANSQPWVESEIRSRLKDLFIDSGNREILMSSSIICKEFFKGKFTGKYIFQILTENIKAEQLSDENGKIIVKTYEYPRSDQAMLNDSLVDNISYVKHRGRAFLFKREEFLSKEEDENIIYKKAKKQGYYSNKKKYQ